MAEARIGIVPALILAAGIAFAGVQVARGIERFRMAERTITVKGLAERDVKSDFAVWTLAFRRAENEFGRVQQALTADRERVLAFLREQGFTDDEVEARPGSDYAYSLELLKQFKARHPEVPTKSGLMVGLGETDDEILEVMRDLRAHDVEMLTIGQYLQPSGGHLPVLRYVHPDTFKMFETEALKMGFKNAACGPMVRSSYWADQQAHGAGVV